MDSDHTFRLPDSAHTAAPWRIHDVAPDFELEDVWALPTPGGPDDFPRLVRQFASEDDEELSAFAVRSLFAVRRGLGRVLGWDSPGTGIGSGVPSLRDRLPDDLWVPAGDGYRGQLAALVKPVGRLGRTYMAGIRPIRRAVVYPPFVRSVGQAWPRYA